MQSDTPDDIAPREAPDAQRRVLQYASQLADAMLQWVKTQFPAQEYGLVMPKRYRKPPTACVAYGAIGMEWAIDRFVQKLGRIAPAFGLGQQNATHRMAPLSLGSCSPNRGACKAHCQKHSSTIGIIRRFVRLRVANKA